MTSIEELCKKHGIQLTGTEANGGRADVKVGAKFLVGFNWARWTQCCGAVQIYGIFSHCPYNCPVPDEFIFCQLFRNTIWQPFYKDKPKSSAGIAVYQSGNEKEYGKYIDILKKLGATTLDYRNPVHNHNLVMCSLTYDDFVKVEQELNQKAEEMLKKESKTNCIDEIFKPAPL